MLQNANHGAPVAPVDVATPANARSPASANRLRRLPSGLLRRYQSMIDIAPDATLVVDVGGRIRVVNRQAEALFGYAPDELIGRSIEALVPEHLRVAHEQRRRRYGEAPRARSMGQQLELTARRKDGREFPVLVSLNPIRPREGGALVISSVRDISDLQQVRAALARAEESESRLRRLERSGIVGMTVGDGRVALEANDAFLEMIGYSRADVTAGLISREALAAPDPDQRAASEIAVQEALATGACRPFEQEYVRKDGTLLPAMVGLVLLEREPVRLLGFVLDRSDQQRLERERQEAEAQARAVVEVNRHMDEFFSTAAHDIRSPVTALRSNLQVAQRRFTRLRAEAVQPGIEWDEERVPDVRARFAAVDESLTAANQSAERLTRAVTLLFDVAQARAGKLTLRLAPCDLAQLVRDQVEEGRAAAPGRDIRVEVPEDFPVCVEADAGRLGQVLANYLSNALKYSAGEKPVVVRLEVTAQLAVVSVQDEGPGLPWGEQSQVWEMFHQAPGVRVRSGVSGSLGLGLHICKRIIELHGGRVGVESTEGEGSIFWLSLKLADPAACCDRTCRCTR